MASTGAASSGRDGKARVLIVDDEEGIRDLLKAILDADYHISEADCGAALQRALDRDQPDVVLLDLNLPDTDGLGLLPAIKRQWPGTEVIVLSGHPDHTGAGVWATEAVNRGAFSVVPKSADFDFHALQDSIRLALARRQQTPASSPPRLAAGGVP